MSKVARASKKVARESLRGSASFAKRHFFFRAASPVARCREATRGLLSLLDGLLSQVCFGAFPWVASVVKVAS